MGRSLWFASAAATLLAACSPYVYHQEITGFANGVETVAAAHEAGAQDLATRVDLQRRAARVAARQRLDFLPGCDAVDPRGDPPRLAECAVVSFGDERSPAPTLEQAHLANDGPLFAALRAYAKSLAAVSNAADSDALKLATQGFVDAAGRLSDAVAKVVPTAPGSTLVGPIGGLIGEGIDFYLDSRRLHVLREVVPAVDPAIAVLGQTVEADLRLIRANQVAQLQKELHADAAPLQSESVQSLSDGDYGNRLDTLQNRVVALNQARAADPRAVAQTMVAAHRELAAALRDNSRQALPVIEAVTAFATAASQAQAAIAAAAAAKN
jgi:hypothetical protein